MSKITSLADLNKRREELKNGLGIQVKAIDPENVVQVKVAMATCGIASGAKAIMEFFMEQLDRRNVAAVVTQTGCMGYCYAEPTIEVKLPGQDPVVFGFVDLKRADQIIEKYIKTGELVDGIIPVNYQTIDLKELGGKSMSKYSMHLLVCGGTSCHASESDAIVCNLRDELEAKGLMDSVQVIMTGCFGFCEKGPIVKVMPDNTIYVGVKPDDAQTIVEEHVIKGKKVIRLLYKDPVTKESVSDSKHMGFFKKQLRVVLRNCGFINPENIDEYIAREGYQALGKVLTEMTPEEVIKEVKASGQRGRGGAGFSTGLKWELARKNQSDVKYVVCNADEGDPGAFMDRSVLEGDPHSVLEAMAICGYSIGSSNGLIYIRAEYPLAIERLKIAINQARESGLLGNNIFGTGFNFDIKLRYGAGAFVCGEETALIHSMEGLRGEPTVKPPFPAEAGYEGKPTNVNNVETFAAIPAIILKGAKWFASIGTEKSKGTKVFALAGKINNVGLIEVPMGTTLREVIFEIGGGIRNGKKFKGIQTGGPSGGCLSEKHLDIPIDFDNQ